MSHDTVCGLANIGNTCYMNSVIQVLAHCPQISKYITTLEFKDILIKNLKKASEKDSGLNNVNQKLIDAGKQTLTVQLYRLLTEMAQTNHIAPASFKRIISDKNDTFIGCGQNDSHELLNFIIDTFHEETKDVIEKFSYDYFPQSYHTINNIYANFENKLSSVSSLEMKKEVITEYNRFIQTHKGEIIEHTGLTFWANYHQTNKSFVSDNMSGMFISIITCASCKSFGIKFDVYTSISLEIPLNLDKITLYDCFDKFTGIEVLDGDNSYQCTPCGQKRIAQKRMLLWGLPNILIIHLKRFQTEGERIRKIDKFVNYPMKLDLQKYIYGTRPNKTYELTSVIHHYGCFGGGHYVAFSKCKGSWYEFNDSSTSLLSDDDIQRKMITDDSYILVYSA